jgi:Uma2 family endonuclease
MLGVKGTEIVEPTLRRWSLEEYYQMGDMGFFIDERVELIDGEIIEMFPRDARDDGEPTLRRWSVKEYYQMGEMGIFNDERVELIDGEIIKMPPQKDLHAISVSLTDKFFSRSMPEGYWVRSQLPLHLGERSEPEPDISIVAGNPRDYVGKGHPQAALLVIEVSETTLRFDRGPKASFYASAAIQDYWIVNLIDRCVEVYRSPVADSSAQFGFRYAEKLTFSSGQTIKPLAFALDVAVADLLP